MQYPQTGYPFTDNNVMAVTKHIAENLNAWMAANPALDTIKKVSAKSHVGFGTVQRARNGDGNTTIQNLEAIAAAFRRSVDDLIRSPSIDTTGNVTPLMVMREPAPLPYLVQQIADVAQTMNDVGQARLLERAEQLRDQYPPAMKNHSN